MPARKPPTERQRRLGAELRKMREHVGPSHAEAAAVHRTDRTTVGNVESGRFGVSPDRVRVWAANYSCPDHAYIDALVDMARESRTTNWWDEYRGATAAKLLDLAEMEHYASRLRSVQITHNNGDRGSGAPATTRRRCSDSRLQAVTCASSLRGRAPSAP